MINDKILWCRLIHVMDMAWWENVSVGWLVGVLIRYRARSLKWIIMFNLENYDKNIQEKSMINKIPDVKAPCTVKCSIACMSSPSSEIIGVNG
jgi:hypothetical protein